MRPSTITEMLAGAFEACPLSLLVIDASDVILGTSAAAAQFLDSGPLEGRALAGLVHPSQRQELLAIVRSARAGATPARQEIRFVRASGASVFGGVIVSRVQGRESAPASSPPPVLLVIRDVTEERERFDSLVRAESEAAARLRAEAAQRVEAEDSRAQLEVALQRLLETLPDLVIVHRAGKILWVNDVVVRALGHEQPSDLVGRPVLDIVHPGHRAALGARMRAVLDASAVTTPRVTPFLHRDGTYRDLEFSGVPVPFRGSLAVLALGRDVTQQRRLEAQLVVSERLVAMGTLVAGVAHEINNPLTYLVANLMLAEEALTAPEGPGPAALAELIEMVGECREGADRIRKIVLGLKNLSRSSDASIVPVEVRPILERAITFSTNEIRHRARLVTDFGVLPIVLADDVRLGQVFINVLVNAAQAIPEGRVQEHEIRVTTRTDSAGRACVQIRDTGCGVPREHLRRVFDPFFTLKPIGAGTGLGLSVSHGIVTSLGGSIHLDSTPGEGTVVEIVLPPAGGEDLTTSDVAPVVAGAGRRGRILVVDDEPHVRASLYRLLGGEHEVLTMGSGAEALAYLDVDARVDVILCDLMMPDVTGMALHAELSARVPEHAARMVFLTGGAFTAQALAFLEAVPNPRVDKPFDGPELRRIVAALVDGA